VIDNRMALTSRVLSRFGLCMKRKSQINPQPEGSFKSKLLPKPFVPCIAWGAKCRIKSPTGLAVLFVNPSSGRSLESHHTFRSRCDAPIRQ